MTTSKAIAYIREMFTQLSSAMSQHDLHMKWAAANAIIYFTVSDQKIDWQEGFELQSELKSILEENEERLR